MSKSISDRFYPEKRMPKLNIVKMFAEVITEKSEYSQALARFVVMSILLIHFTITQHHFILLSIAIGYCLFSLLWVGWTLYIPYIIWRQYAAAFFDQATITGALWLAGPEHIGIFLLYFWIIIGNGYRFGSKSALVSSGFGFVLLAIIMPTAPTWVSCVENQIEILIGFALVTAFTYRLIHNLEQEIDLKEDAQKQAKRAESKSSMDDLTGLRNRSFAEEWMNKKHRKGARVGILFLDLDNFKRFNDNYGHHVGDLVLINISKRLINCIRGNDIVCRYAGDEFIILIDDEDPTTIDEIAKRITTALNKTVELDTGERLTVTGSVGVAILGIHGNTPSETLKNADAAMYMAKRAGRNRVAWYEDKIKV